MFNFYQATAKEDMPLVAVDASTAEMQIVDTNIERNLIFDDTNPSSVITQSEATAKDSRKTIKTQAFPQNTPAESPSKKNRNKLKFS
ncbi:hypothetical protein ACH5RR_026754 [Cinchona calisaya]|uniref:Uncharacterized protein n=1 Tax=Cinchona calisaya TaxID=153742 RepID=A0ABD2Z7E7_9GENT